MVAVGVLGARDATAACEANSLTCAVVPAELHAKIKDKLPTELDSGWVEKGSIKVRTRFSVDPVGGEPLVSVDMPRGALLEVSWPEKGVLTVKPVTSGEASGTMNVHYTLKPHLEASIYGIGNDHDANSLLNMVSGASFNDDSRGSAPILPWGFRAASVQTTAPDLDQSTIFGVSFYTLGVDYGTAEGMLYVQASTRPTFSFVTKEVRLDSETVTTDGGAAKITVADLDGVDVVGHVTGELGYSGTLKMRPVVTVDSVYGVPTYGLGDFGFTAVSKDYVGEPQKVAFDAAVFHIPLANVKVPSKGVDFGTVKAGKQAEKSIKITNTGELGAILTFTSSDPQFSVPKDSVQVGSKGDYDLAVKLKPANDGSASATITVKSNDPDSPEQTFRVGANGASLDSDDDSDSPGHRGNGVDRLGDLPMPSSGCSVASTHRASGFGWAGLGAGLGLAALVARRSRHSSRP
ncbi:hypothetical protein AKJ09_07935 [Labilithrix luteola]|uniref:HYDIN/VesB/CFA65-like Ig-like domain-containing protein n=1 Tax=Labilithrix luteola TaxID=1391654 RepID=A0A0K1Q6K3_9BACT|nr:choice-of-anchor D domain-containing protein [Labilithrix luteola]AKV01272.1 hypothetical protein AKJ09_07935 [Labilithrix luteola]